MTSFDAAKARLDQALARLSEEVAANSSRATQSGEALGQAAHDALVRDYEVLREERDGLASRLADAEQRVELLADNADELGRRLQAAIAKVEQLMEG